jgi:hypothetical protein
MVGEREMNGGDSLGEINEEVLDFNLSRQEGGEKRSWDQKGLCNQHLFHHRRRP